MCSRLRSDPRLKLGDVTSVNVNMLQVKFSQHCVSMQGWRCRHDQYGHARTSFGGENMADPCSKHVQVCSFSIFSLYPFTYLESY